MFDETKFGKWKFSSDEHIREIVGDKPEAIDMIEDAANKGYETSCNIMAISNFQREDIEVALDMLGKTPVDVIYIVDSFGSLYPEQMARIADLYCSFANKYGKKVGIHAHNNQQLAFANTIEVCGDGVDWLDATYLAMGRGAGNCAMELLLGFLKNPKYRVYLNKTYWRESGGITVSGGEPLLQIDFLLKLFTKAKAKGVHLTIDTSGPPFTREEPFFSKFNELMKVTDLVMLDIKQIDDAAHKTLTGWTPS